MASLLRLACVVQVALACALWLSKAEASDDELAAKLAKLPAVRAINVSPDGKSIAAEVAFRGDYALRIFDVEPGGEKTVVWRPQAETTIGRTHWTADNKLIVVTDKLAARAATSLDPREGRTREYIEFYYEKLPRVLSRQGQELSNLKFRRSGKIRSWQPLQEPEYAVGELPLFVWTIARNDQRPLFRPMTVDLERGRYRDEDRPVRGSGFYNFWSDPLGKVTFATRDALRDDDEFLYRRIAGRWEELDASFLSQYGLIGVLNENDVIVTYAKPGAEQIAVYGIKEGELLRTLYDGPAYSTAVLMRTPDKLNISGIRAIENGVEVYTWFNEDEQRLYESVAQQLGVSQVRPRDKSLDGRIRVVEVDGGGVPPSYYLVKDGVVDPEPLFREYPDLEPSNTAAVTRMTYTARDGLPLDGYITMPRKAGEGDGPLPLIVFPHGGPFALDSKAYFDAWRQYFAALGYAVFQPNFRGSRGFGSAFERLGFGQWGRAMQTDIDDGLAALLETGEFDPGRVAIVGASYGGYASAMGLITQPDSYQCGISVAGVFDVPGFLGQVRVNPSISYWADYIARDQYSIEQLEQVSPFHRAADVTKPIQLLHGRFDVTVFSNQTKIFSEELERVGAEVTTVFFEESDHYFQQGPDREKLFAQMRSFLSECVPVD